MINRMRYLMTWTKRLSGSFRNTRTQTVTLSGARGAGKVKKDHLKAVLCIKKEASLMSMLYVFLPFVFPRILNSFMVILCLGMVSKKKV